VPFLLVRHASVDYDAWPGRFRGHGIDLLPLTEQGVAEAEAAAVSLRDAAVDLIVTSSMARALHTAMILSWRLHRHVEVEIDLHEWVPDLSQQWTSGDVPRDAYLDLLASGGEWPRGEQRSWEPQSSVRRRTTAVLRRYESAGIVAVITHSGVIEALTGVASAAPCSIHCYELASTREFS
jgi:broad specificity phosphatase PhoE